MATLISDDLIVDALPRLPGWRRDDHRLRRDLPVEGDIRGLLAAEFDELARLSRHPIRVTSSPSGLSVSLTTEDVGGVSEIDLALATRINDLVAGAVPALDHRVPPPRLSPEQVVSKASVSDGDEAVWWQHPDTAEPVMGVPATTSGVMPVPLPDTASDEPEPGIELEQELGAGHGLGFVVRHPGDAD